MLGKPFGLALSSPVDDGQGTDGVRALKHTPGPWTPVQLRPDFWEIQNPEATHKWIAHVLTDADAQLIAAAPDLLEECRKALRRYVALALDSKDSLTKQLLIAAARDVKSVINQAHGIQSANAVPSQTVTDSTEERQNKGENA